MICEDAKFEAAYKVSAPRRNRSWCLLLCLLVVSAVCAVGIEPVRKLDFSEAPEMKELAFRARQIGNEMYPKAIALLTDEPSKAPRQFDIIFKRRLTSREMRGIGEIGGYEGGWLRRTVYLNAEWIAHNPTNFDSIFLHEMTHVAQRYARRAPSHWTEGIAEYVACKLGGTNDPHCAECSNVSPHYRSGYSCAAAFLLYVESNYRSNVVRELHDALRRGSYADTFFAKATGRSLDQLWEEFKKTPAYRPSATEAVKFFESVGFTNSFPGPKQIRARIRRQPGGALTLEAQVFLRDLRFKQQLPGFRKGETGPSVLSVAMPEQTNGDAYPVSRTFDSSIDGAAIVYHYLIVRASWHSDWKLQRAWKTERDGRVLEEYPVP